MLVDRCDSGKSVAASACTATAGALPLKYQQRSSAAALYLLLNAFPRVPSGVAGGPAPTTNNLGAKFCSMFGCTN